MIDLVLLTDDGRERFGIANELDDVPTGVTTTDGQRWVLRYIDDIDQYAIYTVRT